MNRTALFLAFALTPAATAETIRFPLLFHDTAGCRVTSRRAELLERVPAAGSDGVIVIDGRNPTRFSRDPRAVERSDAGLLNSNFLRYDFHVAEPGRHTVFVRVALPPGRSRFVEVLDGRRYTGPFDEENPESVVSTRWIERPQVWLSAGLHRLSLASAGYPMPGIESIVLVPESAALPEDEPLRYACHAVGSREVRTLPLKVPGLRAVRSLVGVPEGVAVEWSTVGSDQRSPMTGEELTASEPVVFHWVLGPEHPVAGPL